MRALHYVSSGEGIPVLLIHGLGDRHTVWRSITPTLVANGCHVIAIDLPGHGLSGGREWTIADTIRRIVLTLESLELTHVHVVGNSFGGYLALRMAVDGLASSVTALTPAGFTSAPHLVLAGGRLVRNRLAEAPQARNEPHREAKHHAGWSSGDRCEELAQLVWFRPLFATGSSSPTPCQHPDPRYDCVGRRGPNPGHARHPASGSARPIGSLGRDSRLWALPHEGRTSRFGLPDHRYG